MKANPLTELLLVLGVTWLAAAAYAYTDHHLEFVGQRLQKAAIFDEGDKALALTAVSPELLAAGALSLPPANKRLDEPAPQAAAARSEPLRPVDPRPQRILIVGDSMVERLMRRLAAYCQHNGHELLPAIWYASTTIGWARDSKLTQLLSEFDPTFVMVVLGSSELTMRKVQRITPAVRAIVARLAGRKHVWVGPPNWRPDSGINDLLAREVGRGRFFRSAELRFERASDGIHPSWSSAAAWMDSVAAWIAADSAVPIRLAEPRDSAPRPAARVYPPPHRSR